MCNVFLLHLNYHHYLTQGSNHKIGDFELGVVLAMDIDYAQIE